MTATPGSARRPISHVDFVESGLVSVVGAAAPNHRIEIGMVGYEGMTGLSIVLGGDRSTNETLVQSAGSALRISTRVGARDAGRQPKPHRQPAALRHVFMVQGSQTALANGRGRLDQRLARWLLMWDDRIQPDALTVTHDFLALLLGVRRQASPSPCTTGRQRPDPPTRGEVRILDREGLDGPPAALRHPGSRICR